MKAIMIIKALSFLYRNGGRDLLIKYISNDENEWDDQVIKFLDEFLGYKERNPNG